HHVVGPRYEHAASGGFDGNIVGAAIAVDIELFNLERLRLPDAGRSKAGCEQNRKCGQKAFAHTDLRYICEQATKSCDLAWLVAIVALFNLRQVTKGTRGANINTI